MSLLMSRKICFVTSGRADYGLLRWVMHAVKDDPELQLQIIATGMHLSPTYGLTYQEIEEDGFFIDARIEILVHRMRLKKSQSRWGWPLLELQVQLMI